MERITESVRIDRPPERVFAFIRNVEGRLRLNPFSRVQVFEKLTEGETAAGARFRIVLSGAGIRTEYESEIVEFVENERIVSRDSKGRLRLTLSLTPTPEGTLLTHDEEFVIPGEVLYAGEERGGPSWLTFLKGLMTIEETTFIDRERERRIGEIKETLRNNLRAWLLRIKEAIEAG